jgi:hypothetical protein
MRVRCVVSVAVAAGLLVGGCATVTRGTTEPLAIQSEPPGAEVELSTGQRCITPCNLELKRKYDYRLTLQKEGFADVVVAVQPRVAGAGAAGAAGNVLIGGIIGLGVDAATGAAMSLGPNPVHVHLVARNPADADRLCEPPDRVAGAICRGQLQAGATREQVLQLLGSPQERKADGQEWRYGHDTLVFDEGGRFASTLVEK